MARNICFETTVINPRGKLLDNGIAVSSHKVTEGVFDQEDLKFRTNELTDFVNDASRVWVSLLFSFKNIQKLFDIELLVNVL
jgi:phospholipase/carboxylesterase